MRILFAFFLGALTVMLLYGSTQEPKPHSKDISKEETPFCEKCRKPLKEPTEEDNILPPKIVEIKAPVLEYIEKSFRASRDKIAHLRGTIHRFRETYSKSLKNIQRFTTAFGGCFILSSLVVVTLSLLYQYLLFSYGC